jgi:hypothetical protein
MIKYALPVAVLYLAVASTAVALPGATVPQLTGPNDIVQVGSKEKNKSHKSHETHHHYYSERDHDYDDHEYRYHGHDYGRRYSYRPNNWQTLGCIAAGPIWYCP